MSTIAIDTETTGLNLLKGCKPYLVLGYDEQDHGIQYRFQVNPETRDVIVPDNFVSTLKKKLKKYKSVVFHNANFDIRAFMTLGIEPAYWFKNFEIRDTMIASHCYKSSNRHGLKENAILYIDTLDSDERELENAVKKVRRDKFVEENWAIAREDHPYLIGSSKELFRADYWLPRAYAQHFKLPNDHPYWEIDSIYGMFDVKRTLGLDIIFDELMDDQQKLRYRTELTRIQPLIEIPHRGISLHKQQLKSTLIYFTKQQEDTNRKLAKLADPILEKYNGKKTEFKPKSPKQLSTILYTHYQLSTDNITHGPNGPSTDKDSLKTLLDLRNPSFLSEEPGRPKRKIPDKFKFIQLLKQSRKVGTSIQYLENYTKFQCEQGKLHTIIGQTRTATGRLASSEPNVMNVGKAKVEEGLFADDEHADFKLRDVFGPGKGYRWFCADYDQFQLRIFATVSESKPLLEAFEHGLDAHGAVAMRIFNKDTISDLERRAAKYINFGILFGAGPKRIEQLAGMPGLYNLFLSQFPNAKKYLEQQSNIARKNGYVHTVAGSRLYVPRDRSYAASCYVIQGTEADIFKSAIVDCHTYLKSLELDCSIVNTVHDELVFEFPRSLDRKSNDFILNNCMRNMEHHGIVLGIPTKVDAKMTETAWSESKSYELQLGKA